MAYEVAGVARPNGRTSTLRQIVTERRVTYGGWCMIGNPFATEVVSGTGCDWLCIDQQHGLIGDEAMRTMVQAADIRDTPSLVRVAWNEPAAVMRALDAGAHGVIVPMVDSPEEARAAARASRYPPRGFRSWGPLRSGMATPAFDPAIGNEQTVCLVMVETVQAVEQLDAILDVDAVDGVFVGPNDLAISHAGSNEGAGRSPRDLEMIHRIADACAARGVAAGISCADVEDAHRWRAAGYTLLGMPSDAGLLGAAMTGTLAGSRREPSG